MSVLDRLESVKIRCSYGMQYRIGMSGKSRPLCKTKANVIQERGSGMAKSAEVVIRRFAQVTDMSLQLDTVLRASDGCYRPWVVF